jgi:predicted Fe-Mo cluster-binding NifX family protein
MNSIADSEKTVLIAVPCYGSRVLPRFGQAREFFFAEVDRTGGTLHRLQRRSWDLYVEPHLVRWLRREDIEVVLCAGIHPRFQIALGVEGIRVAWGFRGEVEEVLRQWLREGKPANENHPNPLLDEAGCPSRNLIRGGCHRRNNQGDST